MAFFGVLYYSGLRPEEAVSLRRCDVKLPDLVWDHSRQCWVEEEGAGEAFSSEQPTPTPCGAPPDSCRANTRPRLFSASRGLRFPSERGDVAMDRSIP